MASLQKAKYVRQGSARLLWKRQSVSYLLVFAMRGRLSLYHWHWTLRIVHSRDGRVIDSLQEIPVLWKHRLWGGKEWNATEPILPYGWATPWCERRPLMNWCSVHQYIAWSHPDHLLYWSRLIPAQQWHNLVLCKHTKAIMSKEAWRFTARIETLPCICTWLLGNQMCIPH